MNTSTAEQQKAFIAEKNLALVRMIVIAFGTITFIFLQTPQANKVLAYALLVPIWIYGFFVLFFKPYKKYPVFLAAWFTYITDCVFIAGWIYVTGGFYSPYFILFYPSIIGVAYRFDLKTSIYTATLYTVAYFVLLQAMDQLEGKEMIMIVRSGYIFIIAYLTNLITEETLNQTEQKIQMQKLAEEVQLHHSKVLEGQNEQQKLNRALKLQNDIFSHAEENAEIGSYAWNLTTNKIDYSDNLFRLLGFEPREFEPTFEKYLGMVHPEDREQLARSREQIQKHQNPPIIVHRVITKQGMQKHMRSSGRITLEQDHYILIGTLQDVSDDIQLNEKLKAKNAELERSNAELASFTYIASHDLQEPVRKIHTFCKLLSEKEGRQMSPTGHDYLNRITASANRMHKLIEAFLNYSRIDNTEVEFVNVNLGSVIEEVKNNLAETIDAKKAKINFKNLPEINGIPIQLHQLFINLIGNALKYSRENTPPQIDISAEKISGAATGISRLDPRQQYWHIMIQDNGIGFNPQYASKIFEVFQRLHSKEQYEGTGIGLAICKKIAQTHMGAITAEGMPAQGAIFHVYLPA
jgi:signal transduction histidine kinase